ncbi:MAG: MaoC family dehydratase N-terminal domain-containing protein [Mycobacteriales bacterium]
MSDWRRSWQPVVARVGAGRSGGSVKYGADSVERGAIRRYLEPLELDCPLHYDPDAARYHGYADVVAPYTSLLTWSAPPMWKPGTCIFTSAERDAQPANSPIGISNQDLPPEATGYFATDMSLSFARPPVVGDRVGRRSPRLVDVALKETRVGRGAFLTSETDVVDAAGELLATTRSTLFVYEPVRTQARDAARDSEDPPAAGEPAALSGQRVLADVREGEALAPIAFPLSVYRLVMAAGANRDFNSIHHNSEYAKASGASEMYANTLFLQGMWERAVREYIGTAGTIKEIRGFRMGSFNTVGDTVTVHGRVERLDREEGTVHLRVWSTNATGTSVGPGTVVVTLPETIARPEQPHPRGT